MCGCLFTQSVVAREPYERASHGQLASNAVACDGAIYSLIGAALLRTGWSSDVEILKHACLVVRVAGAA